MAPKLMSCSRHYFHNQLHPQENAWGAVEYPKVVCFLRGACILIHSDKAAMQAREELASAAATHQQLLCL